MKNKIMGIVFIVGAVLAALLDEIVGFPSKTLHSIMFLGLGIYLLMKK